MSTIFKQIFAVNNKCNAKRHFSQSMHDAISKAEVLLGYSINDLTVKSLLKNSKLHNELDSQLRSSTEQWHPVFVAEK